MNAIFKRMIKEICNEENIKYNFISKDFITVLEKSNKINYLFGYKIGLNNHSLGEICDDKYALYDLLNTFNLPVIKHHIVYNKNNKNDYAKGCNSYEYVHDFFIKNNKNIVIKPNNGTCGVGVYHVTDESEIDSILDKLFKSNFSISMCPYYDIENEYRIIVLNDEVMLKYAKYRPIVAGNGKNTIKELLLDFNKSYFKDKLDDKKYDKVLKDGEVFEYNWKFNLSGGALCKEIDDKELNNQLCDMALNVARKINLKVGSIDIIKTKDNHLFVLEINSGLMLDNYININKNGYDIAKNIYKKAIISLFK